MGPRERAALLLLGALALPHPSLALRDATFDEVLADPSTHFVHGSWLNGPPSNQVGGFWKNYYSASCEFPKVESKMTCCGDLTDAVYAREVLSAGEQICRKQDGSGQWTCAPGWLKPRRVNNCLKDAADACEEIVGLTYKPCGPLMQNNTQKVLSFRSGFYDLLLDLDSLTLTASAPGQAEVITPSATVSGVKHSCAGPTVAALAAGSYPIRLVRQGRYLSHYWIGGVTCGAATAVVEVKVWPDCFEMHLVLDGSHTASFAAGSVEVSSGAGYAEVTLCRGCPQASCPLEQAASANPPCCALGEGMCGAGPSAACAAMPALGQLPTAPGAFAEVKDLLDVRAVEGAPATLEVTRFIHVAWQGLNAYLCADPDKVPANYPSTGSKLEASFLPIDLIAAGNLGRQPSHDGQCHGFKAYKLPLQLTSHQPSSAGGGVLAVTLGVPQAMPMTGEGRAIKIALPGQHARGTLKNDPYRVMLQNPSTTASLTVRLLFHVTGPRGVTGIASMLRNASTGAGSGVHVQISKNWHTKPPDTVPYDGTWYSPVVLVVLPPESQLVAELFLVYQFFGDFHSVSHAQLSLVGWGSNGLWEEVGLGSAGEAICYEADGQQRRSMVTDVRPFLVCGMGSTLPGDCKGSAQATQWTENHGGMDFLIAVDPQGSLQYLTDVRTHHFANGPKITNASYSGVTADGYIHAQRKVSTWTVDDFPRHLHSFHYEVLKDATYKRLVLYQLGSDSYNYVSGPKLVVGDGGGPVGSTIDEELVEQAYSQNVQRSRCNGTLPCWFALLTPDSQTDKYAHRGLVVRSWRARLGGVMQPEDRGYSFSLVGVQNSGVGLEFTLPDDVPALVEGDFISADLEVFLYPKSADLYYGTSQQLRTWLGSAASEPFGVAFMEAKAGNFSVEVSQGSLERRFPVRVRAADSGLAMFSVLGTTQTPGLVPVAVAGVGSSEGGRLWRLDNETWAPVSEPWDVQVDHEAGQGYTFTFSVFLREVGASGSEVFAFGPEAPPPTTTTTTTTSVTRTTTATAAAAATTATATTTVKVKVVVSMTVQGVDYDSMVANPTVQAAFETSIKEAVAASAGSGVKPDDVSVEFSAGSIAVKCTITPQDDNSALAVSTAVGASAELATAVVSKVKTAPGIEQMTTGSIGVVDIEATTSGEAAATSTSTTATLALMLLCQHDPLSPVCRTQISGGARAQPLLALLVLACFFLRAG